MSRLHETWRRGMWPTRILFETDRSRLYLICVFKNESILLEHFLEYYNLLGFTHFLLIDNASSDGFFQAIENSPCPNIILYHTVQSYKEANYGVDWINHLLFSHCRNQFCLVVDADELLLINPIYKNSISSVVSYMLSYCRNVMPMNIVDMYPASSESNYKQGEKFIDKSPFFDRMNFQYYRQARAIYDTFYHKIGGMRKRVFSVDVCIHKLSFFLYDFYPLKLAPGYHFIQDVKQIIISSSQIKLASFPSILFHFKFIKPNLAAVIEKRIANNQDWDNSREYHAYMALVRSNKEFLYWSPEYSQKYASVNDISDFFES